MRLWAGLALLCLMVAGCQHLPKGVVVDVANGTVAVGPCVCKLPVAGVPPTNKQTPVGDEPE